MLTLGHRAAGEEWSAPRLLWENEIGPAVQEADMKPHPKARSVAVRELGTLDLPTCKNLIAGEKPAPSHTCSRPPLHLSKAVEARSPNSRCSRVVLPLKAPEERHSCLFQLLVMAGSPWLVDTSL